TTSDSLPYSRMNNLAIGPAGLSRQPRRGSGPVDGQLEAEADHGSAERRVQRTPDPRPRQPAAEAADAEGEQAQPQQTLEIVDADQQRRFQHQRVAGIEELRQEGEVEHRD